MSIAARWAKGVRTPMRAGRTRAGATTAVVAPRQGGARPAAGARRAGGAARTAGALAAGALLAGCGVPATGVIDVGVPATGLPPEFVPAHVTVYFLDASDPDRLRAVGRSVAGGADPVAAAVRLLFEGPTAHERADVTTDLPRTAAGVVLVAASDTVSIELPAGVPRLGDRAVRQVACTAAAVLRPAADGPGAWRASPRTKTVIAGDGWQREATGTACPPADGQTADPVGGSPQAPGAATGGGAGG